MTAEREIYEDRIRALIEPVIEAEGMELILCECIMMKPRWIVRFYIDKPGGVTLDDCSAVSHLVGDILDIHDVPPNPYTLEVSSPGLNRPLARDKDFLLYRGQHVNVKTNVKIDGMRNFRGVLVDYVDRDGKKALLILVGERSITIPREAVHNAHLEYDFNE